MFNHNRAVPKGVIRHLVRRALRPLKLAFPKQRKLPMAKKPMKKGGGGKKKC